jgi:penicillin-binding protein 2
MANYLQTIPEDWYKQRVSGAFICVVVAFLVLLMRLYYLQVVEGPDFRKQSQNNWFRVQSVSPMRGLIFDRHGELMVENRPSFNVSIVLRKAKNPDRVLRRLAELLDIPPEDLLEKVDNPRSRQVLLKRDISREAVAVIEAHKLDLPGISVGAEPSRSYLEREQASHLLGYLSEISRAQLRSGAFPDHRMGDFIGKFGLEKAYEPYLHGKRGKQVVEVNAFGQVTRVLKTEEAIAGMNLFTTLDLHLQRAAESLLEDKVGTILAMDPSNGHILAMAVRPAFDPNVFVEGMPHKLWSELTSNPFRPLENKALQAQYPPGSTYKIVTAMAGLEEGVITRGTRFLCSGEYEYGDRFFRCWKKKGHGYMTLTSALAQSCDVYFYQVGERLGVDRLARYARACGLGASTGIDLDREAKGLIPTKEWKLRRTGVPWRGGETLSVAIGQGFNLVTPLQMLGLVAAVANGGTRLKPVAVSRIEASDGTLVKEEAPVPLGRLPASDRTLKLIRKGLVDAVNKPSGTGWIARVPGVEVAGKTGTAQVIAKAEDEEDEPVEQKILRHRDHAWFVAFAPGEDPKVAVVVMIEHGEHGSRTAGPIAKKVIETYLGVPGVEDAGAGVDVGESE